MRRSRQSAPISAMGWIVPTSLLAYIAVTSAVSSRSAAATASRLTRPSPSTGRYVTLKPSRSNCSQVCSTAWCSMAVVTMWFPRRRADLDGEVVRLGAAASEDDLGRPAVQERRDRLVRLVQRRQRLAPQPVDAAGIAEVVTEKRQHALNHRRVGRRGRRVIHIDNAIRERHSYRLPVLSP